MQAAETILGGLLQGGVFALLALGLSLVWRGTGVINLAQGGFAVLGALIYTSLATAGWAWPVAALVGIAATTVFGAALGAVVFVPALTRLPNSGMLMLTAGMMTLIDGLALLIWGSDPYAAPSFSGERPVHLLGLMVPTQGFWIAGVAVAILLGTRAAFARTALGRAMLASAENPLAARLMGIDVAGLSRLSFTLAACVGAVGGIAVAPLISIQFDTGRFFTNAGFMTVAIGGLQSLGGAIAGGLFLGVAEQLGAGYVSTLFANAVALVLLLAVLLFRPQGLFTTAQRRSDVRAEARVARATLRFGRAGTTTVALGTLVLAAAPAWAGTGLLTSLTLSLTLAIAVVGLDVLMGYGGQVNLGQAGFMAIGGYGASLLVMRAGLPFPLATLGAMVMAAACAAVLAMATGRLRGGYLALATLAFGLLVDSFTVGLGGVTGGPSGLVGIPNAAAFGFTFDSVARAYWLAFLLLALVLALLSGALQAGFGRALNAIRTDEMAAAALGIEVGWHRTLGFMICAALGALAGALYAAQLRFLSPEMVATPHSFELIAMLVLGGEGTLAGGVLGAIAITLLPTLAQPLADAKILGEGLILVLIFRFLPEGVLGRALRVRA
jgi:ABC-type branched-subunit amino acid transport system permease subunit